MSGTVDFGKVVGNDGAGMIQGGSTGQILVKKSNTDYDAEWQTLANQSAMGTKVDKDQGSVNAGKFLVVGNDGMIELKTIGEASGGEY